MTVAPRSPWRPALAFAAAVAAVALVGPWLAPYPANEIGALASGRPLPPSLAHPFGTDALLRDVLSRVLAGARVSLGVSVVAVAVAISLGTAVGVVAALAGRWTDAALMRLTDAALAFPRLLLLLLVVASLGTVAPAVLGVIIGATGWMTTARLARNETRRLLATEHLRAAVALGVPRARLLRRHLLPSLLPTLVTAATVAFAAAIPLEAGLSFLGLGVQPPDASWGNIITGAEGRVVRDWWLVVFPTAAIVATVAAANAVAERLAGGAAPR